MKANQNCEIALKRLYRGLVLCGILISGVGLLGGSTYAEVCLVETPLGVADDSTGTEIENDGTLVAAYHFGDPAAGLSDVTVHGVTFSNGVSAIDWENGTVTYNDPAISGFQGGTTFNYLFGNIQNTDYKQLINSFMWGWYNQTGVLTFTNLMKGHSYRLQLIMGNASNAQLTLDGTPYTFNTGNVNDGGIPPAMLTATWTAGDAPFVLSWTALNGSAFSGYVLQDISPSVTLSETPLSVSDSSTGAEIANDRTLVSAYHFGDPSAGLSDVTVHGVTFSNGVNAIDWETGTVTYNDPVVTGFQGGTTFNYLFRNIQDSNYKQLITSFTWGWYDQTGMLNFTNLTKGHTYRLQLIMGNASHAQLSLGATPYTFSTGNVNDGGIPPAMLTVIWKAVGAPFLVTWTSLNGSAFSGYVLHDLTPDVSGPVYIFR